MTRHTKNWSFNTLCQFTKWSTTDSKPQCHKQNLKISSVIIYDQKRPWDSRADSHSQRPQKESRKRKVHEKCRLWKYIEMYNKHLKYPKAAALCTRVPSQRSCYWVRCFRFQGKLLKSRSENCLEYCTPLDRKWQKNLPGLLANEKERLTDKAHLRNSLLVKVKHN